MPEKLPPTPRQTIMANEEIVEEVREEVVDVFVEVLKRYDRRCGGRSWRL